MLLGVFSKIGRLIHLLLTIKYALRVPNMVLLSDKVAQYLIIYVQKCVFSTYLQLSQLKVLGF